MSQVTKHDAREAIRRLSVIHRPPPDREAAVEEWVKALRDVSNAELESGVDAYLREGGTYFPKPSVIRKLAHEGRRTEGGQAPDTLTNRCLRWEQDHGEEGCPVCGAKLKALSGETRRIPAIEWSKELGRLIQLESPSEEARVGVFHNLAKHHEAKIPAIGHWTNTDDVGPAAWVGERPDRPLTESLRP